MHMHTGGLGSESGQTSTNAASMHLPNDDFGVHREGPWKLHVMDSGIRYGHIGFLGDN
jgi:hypothetical protein